MRGLYKSGNNQDDNDNWDNIKVPISRNKKVATTIAKAANPAIKGLLMVLIKLDLNGEGLDWHNVSIKKI